MGGRLAARQRRSKGLLPVVLRGVCGVVGGGPWLFNTSKTAGTFITDDRMYRRLALEKGDPDYPVIHGCGSALCGPECRQPEYWEAAEMDAAMRDLHLVKWKTRPGGQAP